MSKTMFIVATFAFALVAMFAHADTTVEAAATADATAPVTVNAMPDTASTNEAPYTLSCVNNSTLIVQVRRTNGNSIGTNGEVDLVRRCPLGQVCVAVVYSARTNSKGRAIFRSMPAGTYDVTARNVHTGRKAKGVMTVGPCGRTWLHLTVR